MAPALGLARYLSCKALDRACCSLNAFNILGSGFASRQCFFSGSGVPDMEGLVLAVQSAIRAKGQELYTVGG